MANPEVVSKGGTSGNREDAIPHFVINTSFDRQEVQDTSSGDAATFGGTINAHLFNPNRAVSQEHATMPTKGTPDDSAI